MDKNSIIGFILIALILFGFTFFESSRARKIAEQQRQLDSIALAQNPVDTLQAGDADMAAPVEGQAAPAEPASIYRDAMLEAAHNAEAQVVTLENDLVKLDFTTKGAQPYSAQLKKYSSYGGGELFLFKEGGAEYATEVFKNMQLGINLMIFKQQFQC